MDHSKRIKTIKTVILLVGVVIVFLLVGRYYRNLLQQNSGNVLSQDVIRTQKSGKDAINTTNEETGAYVNIRKADNEEETEHEGKKQNSSLEFEVEEKDFTNSNEWVHIIEFE